MISETTVQTPYPNEHSLERLHIINKIRDILHTETIRLTENRVLGVLGFGSAINGTATPDSDIDVCFVIESKSWEDPAQQTKREKFYESILDGLPFKPKRQFYGQEKPGKVIHVTVEEIRSKTLEIPSYISDSIILWEHSVSD